MRPPGPVLQKSNRGRPVALYEAGGAAPGSRTSGAGNLTQAEFNRGLLSVALATVQWSEGLSTTRLFEFRPPEVDGRALQVEAAGGEPLQR